VKHTRGHAPIPALVVIDGKKMDRCACGATKPRGARWPRPCILKREVRK
jgi:hypothetical protein